jgi:hypothetical protein
MLNFYKKCIYLLFFLIFVPVICPGQAVQKRISVKSPNCSAPRVAVNSEGKTYVVWQGKLDGRSRIFFREQSGREWGSEIILDQSEWGDNSDPSIALDDMGNPHIAWSYSDEECSSIYYSFRLGQDWIHYGTISKNMEKNCEFPHIAVQNLTNRVYVVWQEGKGSRYVIKCAARSSKGRFNIKRISEMIRKGYNLYPVIFMEPIPVISWYGVGDSDFVLYSALLNIQTGEWMQYEPSGLEKMPVNRLPYVISDSGGILHVVWYDSDESTDRIYYASQGDSVSGKGKIVDDNPEKMNNLPRGVLDSNGKIFICWRGESLFGGQIFLTLSKKSFGLMEFGESILISDGQKLFYTQPDCVSEPSGAMKIVWVSNALDGGDGAVYIRRFVP